MKFKGRGALLLTIITAQGIAVAAALGGCDDLDTPPPASTDGGGPEATPTTDAPVQTDAPVTDAPIDTAKPPPAHQALFAFFNAVNQPKTGMPNILFPSTAITVVRPANPARAPDKVTPGSNAGFGCTAFKFTSTNPNDPKGPSFNDSDMGAVTVTGFTGGNTPAGPIPNPMSCTRQPNGDAGLLQYRCNIPPAPASGFLKPTDALTLTAAGGQDVKAFTVSDAGVSPIDNLVVTQDLWALPTTTFDGTADLTLNYNCGTEACKQAVGVVIQILTTDGESPDAGPDGGPPNPFVMPPPVTEYGSLTCLDLFPLNPTSFKVPKEILATMPASWKAARVTVATASGSVLTTPDGIPVSVFGGHGVFGITRK